MCGVIGIIGSPQAAYEVSRGLLTLQHRGQDSAGVLSFDFDRDEFHLHKDLGFVSQVLSDSKVQTLVGSAAIGHTRYATVGSLDRTNAQPMTKGFPFGIGMVHNGNIVNVSELQAELKNKYHYHCLTKNDLEVMLNLICRKMAEENIEATSEEYIFEKFKVAVKEMFLRTDGGYSVLSLVANWGLFAFRDPHGIRPLIWGEKESPNQSHCFASETVAFDFLGYKKKRDLKPGELVFIAKSGRIFSEVIECKSLSPCMFEWVYFSSPESEFENTSVYAARLKLGQYLAKDLKNRIQEEALKIDVVVPVPDTSRTAAISLAEELRLPYRELLIKNRYVQRSFILSNQSSRNLVVDLKLNPIRSEIQGKDVLLVDDSIVRGTTSRKLVSLLKSAGAKSVYLALTCPPLKYPCFYGIDFPSSSELIAQGKTVEQIAKELTADGVFYISIDGLSSALEKIPEFCRGCLTGCYPTKLLGAESFSKQRNKERSL